MGDAPMGAQRLYGVEEGREQQVGVGGQTSHPAHHSGFAMELLPQCSLPQSGSGDEMCE